MPCISSAGREKLLKDVSVKCVSDMFTFIRRHLATDLMKKIIYYYISYGC
jgi:hypothetical protein